MNTSFFHPYRGIVIVMLCAIPARSAQLIKEENGGVTTLRIDANPVFHTTDATVSEEALIELSDPTFLIAHWMEPVGGADPVAHSPSGRTPLR